MSGKIGSQLEQGQQTTAQGQIRPTFCSYLLLFSQSVVPDSAIPWTAAHQASLCFTISLSLLKLTSIESMMPINISSSVAPFSSCLQSFPASGSFPMCQFGIRWPKYWSFIFSISPSNEYSGLISFTIDWFDLLAVQGTPKSLFQYFSSRASILWHSAFFMVQPKHDYWKNHSFG